MAKILAFFMAIITALCIFVDKVFQVPATPTEPTTSVTTEATVPEETTVPSAPTEDETTTTTTKPVAATFSYAEVPAYTDDAYVTVNNGVPYFKATEITSSVFENYAELDSLGRCGVTYANICKELMPTEDRGEIGMVKPSGWTYNGKSNNNKYDFVDGKYIYNRCHLIGFQLAGENANEKNLITGTRYLNIEGMLPFENMVADYVKETDNHVLYRVTPIFKGNELVARGVLMEGYSVEDKGSGIKFCVFAYNVEPGVTINYSTGQNTLANSTPTTTTTVSSVGYVINTNTKKIHTPYCEHVASPSSNMKYVSENIDNLLSQGYTKCKTCNPK